MTGPLELPGMPCRRPATFAEARCGRCGAFSLYQYRAIGATLNIPELAGAPEWLCAPCSSRNVAELRGACLPWAERHVLADGIACWLGLPPLAEWPEFAHLRPWVEDGNQAGRTWVR